MEAKFIKYLPQQYSIDESLKRSADFYEQMNKRRSVRSFSNKMVPQEIIENIVKTASTAPSGAHKQPWYFACVNNLDIKQKIREAAEEEEYTNYNGRMSEEWLKDLDQFKTNHIKPFLEIAPWLIVVFRRSFDIKKGQKKTNYYVNESVGLACGMLLTAIHNAGLASLTHTPSPMNFLAKILNRPKNEKPFLLIPVGYPAEDVGVPDLKRKPLNEIAEFYTDI